MGDHGDVARALVGALNDRDLERAQALCAGTVVVEPLSTDRAPRRPYVGHDGLRDYFIHLASTWAVLRIQTKEVRASGRYVGVVGTIRARSLDGSFETEAEIGLVLRINQELVAGVKVYADAAEALSVVD